MLASYSDLKGKHVFITGGGSGIGAALTEGFLLQGANVSFVQRSDATEFVTQMMDKTGCEPQYYHCDLTDIEKLKNVMNLAQQRFGSIDILINNAGNDVRHKLEDYSVEDWDDNHAINLRPYFFTSQFVIPFMKEKSKGVIVNISSASYMMGNSGYPAYVAANAAVMGLTRALAREVGEDNIRVNTLVPGWVLTQKQIDKWANPVDLAAHLEKQCLKQHLMVEDMVDPTLFLASETSKMMTGQVLVIDGGVVVSG